MPSINNGGRIDKKIMKAAASSVSIVQDESKYNTPTRKS